MRSTPGSSGPSIRRCSDRSLGSPGRRAGGGHRAGGLPGPVCAVAQGLPVRATGAVGPPRRDPHGRPCRRTRTGLNADASELDPAIDPALDVVLERGPRRRKARTVARSVGIAAVVSVFLAGGFALRAVRGGGAIPGDGSLTQVSPIDGAWQMTITVQDGLDAGLDYGRARQLAGPRQLELSLGVVRVIRPGPSR